MLPELPSLQRTKLSPVTAGGRCHVTAVSQPRHRDISTTSSPRQSRRVAAGSDVGWNRASSPKLSGHWMGMRTQVSPPSPGGHGERSLPGHAAAYAQIMPSVACDASNQLQYKASAPTGDSGQTMGKEQRQLCALAVVSDIALVKFLGPGWRGAG